MPRDRPRRIVYVANGASLGGGARVLAQAMRGLDSSFTPHLIVPSAGTFSEWAAAEGIPWSIARSGGRDAVRGRWATYRNALELVAAARGAAILHAEAVTCFPPVGLAGRLLGIPRICHVQFPPAAGELPWALRYGADLVLTVYSRQAEEIRPDVPGRIRILAVPNGIEVDDYAAVPAPDRIAALRRNASHVAVLVGHVSEVKGYPTFIRAAARLRSRYPHARYLCAGGETIGVGYTERMRALSAELGVADQVEFLGAVSDIRPVLRAAEVFVLPSEQEGLPLAALEAMCCGLPVVSTPVNGVPEAVLHGETGMLVPPRDDEALSAALDELFADPARSRALGLAGAARVRSRFSVLRVQEELNAIYHDLHQRSAPGQPAPC